MTCTECEIVHGELLDKHGDVIGETEHIELCAKHELTDRLAEALRNSLGRDYATCPCHRCTALVAYYAAKRAPAAVTQGEPNGQRQHHRTRNRD